MNTKALIEALEANTAAHKRLADSIDSLSNSCNDLAVMIDDALFGEIDEGDDSPLLRDFFAG